MTKENTDRYHIVKITSVDESTITTSEIFVIVSAGSIPKLFWAVSLYSFTDRTIKKIEIVMLDALFIQGDK